MTLTDTDYLKLFRACRYLGQDGEDAAQDAALFLMAHPGEWRDRQTGEMRTIDQTNGLVGLGVAFAKGRIRNAHRRALVLDSLDKRQSHEPDAPTLADTLTAKDDKAARDIIRDAMRAIPKASRSIVRLLYAGYTQVEIARRMGISQPAISKKFAKLRASNL